MALGIADFTAQLAALQAQFNAGTIDEEGLADGLRDLWTASENIPALFDQMQQVIDVKAAILTAWQAALNVKGQVASVSALPAEADDRDAYQLVNTADPLDGHLFTRVAGVWTDIGPLGGERGASAFDVAVAVALANEETPPADEAAFIQELRQPAIDAAASADEVREATDQVRMDTLDAKEATEAVTAAANNKIVETEDVRAATDQVRVDTLVVKAQAQAVVDAAPAVMAAKAAAEAARDAAATSAAVFKADNILFDSFNPYTYNLPTLGGWDWYASTAYSFTQTSANVPLTTPVAQLASGGSFNKVWDFSKLGLKVGDKLTISALVWCQGAAGLRANIYLRTADSTVLASVTPALSGIAGLQIVTATITVPAGAVSRLYVRVTGAGLGETGNAFEVGGIFASASTVAPQPTRAEPSLSYVLAWLNATNLDARFASFISSSGLTSALAPYSLAVPLGKNLFNPLDPDYLPGYYIQQPNGNPAVSASYNATGFMAVTPGDTYTRSASHQMAFYDASKVYVSGRSPASNVHGPETFVVPAGCYFARLTIPVADAATFQFERGASATSYQAYGRYIDFSQIPAGGITSAKLAAAAVTPDRTNFFGPGKNMFNPADADVLTDFYIQSGNGVPAANAVYTATGYIPVTAGASYMISEQRQLAFYDAAKVFISGVAASVGPVAVTAPAGSAYMRCSIPDANLATFQVELGTVKTDYQAYKVAILAAFLPEVTAEMVNTSRIVDGAVTPAKASFFVPSKNLFNPADPDVLNDYYIVSGSGVPGANGAYTATGYIPVTAGAAYTISFQGQIAFYNALKAYISGVANAGGPASVTAPAGAAYLRCSIPDAALATFQVEAGAVQTSWVAYGLVISPAYLPTTSAAATRDLVQDVVLPRKVYVLVGSTSPNIEQANLYFANILRGNRGDKLVDCAASYGRQYNECWRLEAGNTGTGYGVTSGSFTLQVTVTDYAYSIQNTASTEITLVSKAASTAVRLLVLGDSITRDGTYANKVATKLPAVILQGIRHYSTDPAALNREGRGGWTLASYFTAYATTTGYESPFMFPDGVSGANYRGNVVFWKKAINIAGNPNDAYDLDGFQKIARGWADSGSFLYDANGYPTSPVTGWVVYDPALAAGSRFQEWNGTAWAALASQPATWSFDFGKYLTRYAAAFADGAPTHLSILLGANDFQTTVPDATNLAAFKTRIDASIASARAAVPGIKVIINLPVLGAEQDAWGMALASGGTAERYRQNIQAESRFLIANYDSAAKEAEGTYVCAMGAFVDPIYAFDQSTENPNIYATGVTIKRHNNWVHPNATVGHAQMGDALAAIVQATR